MTADVPAVSGLAAVAVDAREPATLARWWQRLLGGEIELDPDVPDPECDASLLLPSGLNLDFLGVPDGKRVKNRLHLDLRSTDFDAAVEQALALGATRADDVYDGGTWQVLRDPEGNEFCILRPKGGSGT